MRPPHELGRVRHIQEAMDFIGRANEERLKLLRKARGAELIFKICLLFDSALDFLCLNGYKKAPKSDDVPVGDIENGEALRYNQLNHRDFPRFSEII